MNLKVQHPSDTTAVVDEPECICTDSNLPARRDCPYCYPADLDRTPVYDLERWQHDHDPARAAQLDALLDERFGPVTR